MKKPHTLIVGGTRGLGAAVARSLRDTGHAVSVISRNAPRASGRRAVHVAADVADPDEARLAVNAVRRAGGKIDNIILAQRFRGIDDGWDGELATTLAATKNIIEAAAAGALAPKAAVVAVSSNAGTFIVDDQPAVYHASKAALEQLVRFYAVKLGPRGVRVNAVAPSAFVKDESRAHYARDARLKSFYRKASPLGRMITAADVAFLIRCLIDPRCCLTGQSLAVDGGLSLSWPESVARRAGLFGKK